MDEQNANNSTTNVKPPKQKGKKTWLKVLIAVLVVAVIAAVVVVVLVLTGVLDINLNKESKMEAGVDKLIESYSNPIEEVSATTEENGLKPKVLDNISTDRAIEVSTEVSANIGKLESSGMTTSEKKEVQQAAELLNKTNITASVSYNGDDQAYANATAKVDNVELSGEILYDGTQLGIRSEELNPKWLVISNSEMKELVEQDGVDLDEIKDTIDNVSSQTDRLLDAVTIDDNTQKEIQDRYKNVLKDYIKEKSKDIEKEKTEIKLNGKDKKCEKIVLELDDDDLKELLKNYVDTFSNDDQVKDILKSYFTEIETMLETTGQTSSASVADELDNVLSQVDSLKEEIDELSFDGKLILSVYGSATETYRTDIDFKTEQGTISLQTTFNDKETVTVVHANITQYTQKINSDLMTITMQYDKNYLNYKIDLSELMAQAGESGTWVFEANYKTESNKIEASFGMTTPEGNLKFTLSNTVNKNEDTEYDSTITAKLEASIDGTEIDTSLNLKTNVKLDDVTIPTINESETVNMTDQAAVEVYKQEVDANAQKLIDKFGEIDIIKEIVEAAENL